MTIRIEPGMYVTAKTLRLLDANAFGLFRSRVRERGYRVSDNYGCYKDDIHDTETIMLHYDGDIVCPHWHRHWSHAIRMN